MRRRRAKWHAGCQLGEICGPDGDYYFFAAAATSSERQVSIAAASVDTGYSLTAASIASRSFIWR